MLSKQGCLSPVEAASCVALGMVIYLQSATGCSKMLKLISSIQLEYWRNLGPWLRRRKESCRVRRRSQCHYITLHPIFQKIPIMTTNHNQSSQRVHMKLWRFGHGFILSNAEFGRSHEPWSQFNKRNISSSLKRFRWLKKWVLTSAYIHTLTHTLCIKPCCTVGKKIINFHTAPWHQKSITGGSIVYVWDNCTIRPKLL
jgi:hypothetical protein